MRERRWLLFAALLLLLSLGKLLFPEESAALRDLAEQAFWPGAAQRAEAWGRALGGEEERMLVFRPGEGP